MFFPKQGEKKVQQQQIKIKFYHKLTKLPHPNNKQATIDKNL